MGYSQNDQNPILSSGEVVGENVNRRDSSTDNAHTDPPQNPTVNPQLYVHALIIAPYEESDRN
jgi:hypothetical protein